MTPAEALAALHAAGLLPRAAGGRLFVQRERLTDELAALIRAHKDALLALLLREQALADAACSAPPPWGSGDGEGVRLLRVPCLAVVDRATGEAFYFPAREV